MRIEINRKARNHHQNARPADASFAVSRRQLLTRVMIAAAGGIAVLGIASPALAKMTQQTVGYQANPNNGLKCSDCTLFRAPSSCIMVDGTISPDGWCKLFAKKSS